jgi:hypothetical protein
VFGAGGIIVSTTSMPAASRAIVFAGFVAGGGVSAGLAWLAARVLDLPEVPAVAGTLVAGFTVAGLAVAAAARRSAAAVAPPDQP